MTKVLIVDDEPIVRIGLKALGDWEKEGFYLNFEAANGKAALAVLEENSDIDIMITDINMPVMDGLELIKRAKDLFPHIVILVLSAYSDYELVRQSFKNGVFDYIIKTDMAYEKILRQLQNAEKDFVKQNKQKQRLDELKTQEEKVKKYHLREALLTGNSIYPLPTGTYFTVSLFIDNSKELETSILQDEDFCNKVLNIIKNSMDQFECLDYIDLSKTQYALIFKNPKKFYQGSLQEYKNSITRKLRSSLTNYMNICVTAGVGSFFNSQEQLAGSYNQAAAAASLRFYYGKGKVYTANELVLARKLPHTGLPELSSFSGLLASGDYGSAQIALENLLISPEYAPAIKIEEIFLHYRNILHLFYCDPEHRMEIGTSYGDADTLYQTISEFETLLELNAWFLERTTGMLDYLKQQSSGQINDFILKAKEYVRKKYSDPGMNVEMVSSYVSVSQSHFSTTFAKQTGKKFHDYLVFVRINKAKELIEKTQLKDYEIAQEIGVASSETFSRLFKKMVGISPREYRKKSRR